MKKYAVPALALLFPAVCAAQSIPQMDRRVTLQGPTGLNWAMSLKADATNGVLANPTEKNGTYTAPSISGGTLTNSTLDNPDITNGVLQQSTLKGVSIDGMSTIGGVSITNPAWLGFKTSNQTLNVCNSGCAYSTIHEAFYAALSLAHWALDSTSTFTVQIADGTYNEAWQMVSTDPAGWRVRVIGNTSSPQNVVINFTNVVGNNFGGYSANTGGQIGYIDGMTLNAVGAISSQTSSAIHWRSNSKGAGISAIGNGVVQVGPHMVINGFYYGLLADHGGYMIADGVTVHNAGDVGIFAKFGGVMRCQGCISTYTADSDNSLGSNYMAEQGGHLDIDGAKSDQALYAGVAAITGGSVWANGTTLGYATTGGFGGRGAWGVWVLNGGSVQIENSTIANFYDGVHAQAGGSVDVSGTTIHQNNNNGITADGGVVRGFVVSITDNVGYGVQATHMGAIELYQTFSKMSNNTAGNVSQNPAGTENGASYGVASIVLE
ncbi:hypothetical protein ACF3NX_12645 [Acetobacter orientalis]|uniref:hypothetical protein n=1 Tax=Acetobacter orientalis TaxID=146474 RepID=UPI00386B6005